MIYLNNNRGSKWMKKNNIFVKGYAYDKNNKLLIEDSFINYFSEILDENTFVSKIKELNGFFSVVVRRENIIYAAVDHVRSYPLFYKEGDSNDVCVLDEINKQEIIDKKSLVKDSIIEFVSAGYTISNKTLIEGYYNLLAGQYLKIEKGKISVGFHSSYYHQYSYDYSQEQHFKNLNLISEKVFDRIKKVTLGKTIVIPLSGGYDSRYIAASLKKIGIDDVICYTYGRRNSFEVETSRKVAEKLGYDWHFVEYNEEEWKNILESKSFDLYNKYASNYTSLPTKHEFFAIQTLKANSVLPANSVFIPGFSGDMLGGSLLPQSYFFGNEKILLNTKIEDYIYNKYFSNPFTQKKVIKERLLTILRESILKHQFDTPDEFASYFEEWFLHHRIGKHVNNALRVYEFFGYTWMIPLWDRELVDYWNQVPNKERNQNTLYNKYLLEDLFKPLKIGFIKPDQISPSRFRTTIKKLLPKNSHSVLSKWMLFLKGNTKVVDVLNYGELSKVIYSDFKAKKIILPRGLHPNILYSLWFLHFHLGINIKEYIE